MLAFFRKAESRSWGCLHFPKIVTPYLYSKHGQIPGVESLIGTLCAPVGCRVRSHYNWPTRQHGWQCELELKSFEPHLGSWRAPMCHNKMREVFPPIMQLKPHPRKRINVDVLRIRKVSLMDLRLYRFPEHGTCKVFANPNIEEVPSVVTFMR